MLIALLISLGFNVIFLYYLIHDTRYYKGVIKDLQDKYKKVLEDK